MNRVLSDIISKTSVYAKRNAPSILSGVAIAGVIATTISAIHIAPKALIAREKTERSRGKKLDIFEKTTLYGLHYIPTILLGGGTIFCILASNSLNKQQQAHIASAYIILERSYKDYKKKLVELHGTDLDNVIRDLMMVDRFNERETPIVSGNLELFYEENSDIFFVADPETVTLAQYFLNRQLTTEGYVTLADYISRLGIDMVVGYEHVGWSIDECLDDYSTAWVDFIHRPMYTDDGETCTRISSVIGPTVTFMDEWS